MTSTHLTYSLVSTPQPLVAGQSGGKISLIASNNSGDTALIHEIKIYIPGPGESAQDLSNQPGPFSTLVPDGWVDVTDQAEPYIVIFQPDDTLKLAKVEGDGLEFQIEGIDVNAQPGSVNLTLNETSYSKATGRIPQIETVVLTCTKADAEFSLGPLIANPFAIAPGDTTVLEWSASGEAAYALDPADLIVVPKGGLAPDVPVQSTELSQNTVFTLTATTSTTGTYLAQQKAYVSVAVPEITSFTVDDTTVAPGQPALLSWTSTNATNIVIFANGVSVAQTDQVNSTNFPIIPPNNPTQFEIFAVFGAVDSPEIIRSSASQPINVTIAPPQIAPFGSTQTTLYADTPVELAWQTENADVVLLEDETGAFWIVPTDSDGYLVDGYQSLTWTLHAYYFGLGAGEQPPADPMAFAQSESISGTKSTITLVYQPCPILFYVHNGMKNDDTKTMSFGDVEIDQCFVGTAGFDFSFNSGDPQQFEALFGGANVTSVWAEGDTSFDIQAELRIYNNSDKYIADECTLDVIGIARRAGSTDASLTTLFLNASNSYTMPDTGMNTPLLGLSYFAISNDHSHQIGGIDLNAGTASGDSDDLDLSDLVAVVYNEDEVDDRFETTSLSAVTIATPVDQPCGFEIQIVDWSSSYATFKYPVQDAAILIHRFSNFTDEKNHDVGRIWSNTVTGTVDPGNAHQLNLDWGDDAAGAESSGFDDLSDTPWYGNTQLLIIARYQVPGA